MRGAHRGVCCSKGTPLIEAELFAATAFAPCTGWPRTVMRGKSRTGNSGHNSAPKAKRRPEPSSRNPVSLHIFDVSAPKGRFGVSRGARKPFGVLAPFALAGENQRLRRQTAAIPPRRGTRQNLSERFTKALPEQRPCAPAMESVFRSFAARSLLRVPVRRSTAPPCARW